MTEEKTLQEFIGLNRKLRETEERAMQMENQAGNLVLENLSLKYDMARLKMVNRVLACEVRTQYYGHKN